MKFYLTPWSGKRATKNCSVFALVFFVSNIWNAVSANTIWRVLEESKPGTLVGNLGSYTRNYANYDLTTPSKNFVYDKRTGNVNTSEVVDRDILSKLCVNGSKLETIHFSSTKVEDTDINVEVFIDDINDSWPQFASHLFARVIPEEAEKGFSVRIPAAKDKDCGVNGTLHYKISNALAVQLFSMKLSTRQEFLEVKTLKKLDRETKQFHIVNIEACDNGILPKCSSTILNITVTDYNDNKPVFHNVESVEVEENCNAGSNLILKLNVTDKDSGNNGKFTLSVSGASEYKELFVITRNNELESKKCLTYNKNKPYISIVVKAEDHGIPVQRSHITIRVNVIDINDHHPELSTLVLSTVRENQNNIPVVGIITASDEDDGMNGNVSLKIVNGNSKDQFYVEKFPGSDSLFYLKLHGMLDREDIAVYNLTIEGSDHGIPPLITYMNLITPVEDENDNYPHCFFSKETIFLSESSPVGTFVSRVWAMDKDEGKNSELKYSLAQEDNSAIFEINEKSGLIVTAGFLDYETTHSIKLQVNVEDNGDPVLSSFCVLTINITDINDNKPLLTNETLKFNVSEDAAVNSVVAKLFAYDADAGKNSELTFSILSSLPLVGETFYLNGSMGAIHTSAALDREMHDFYSFLVMVQDNGDPTYYSTATVELTVVDVNDNIPVFYPREYYVNIYVNQSDGYVAKINAVDADENDVISYYIINMDPLGLFNVDRSTGTVTCSNITHLQMSDLFTIDLIAKDSQGHVSDNSMLHITVIKPEDDLPQFDMDLYSFNVDENVEHGTYIGKVKALSQTSVVDIAYLVYKGDPENVFMINKKGEIRTCGVLDHEKQSLFELQVMAKTSGRRILLGWTSVIIVVEDLNDNQPQFQYPQQLITVTSAAPVFSAVYQARALDSDLGNGGIVKYEMLNNGDQRFSVDASGDVLVAKDLSQTSISFPVITIIASDFGRPQLSSVLNLTINIVEENVHPPFIHTNFDMIPLLQNVPINRPFFNLTASDRDGDNDVYFELSNHDNATYFFGIFPNGQLYVKQPLLLTTQSDFLLKVLARDRGRPSLNSTGLISISVLNTHQHQQIFQNNLFTFDIDENMFRGTVVGELDCLDSFQDVDVDFVGQNSYFTFEPSTREIKTKQVIDRELFQLTTGGNNYVLHAKASHTNALGLHTVDLATIVVEINDRNDNTPVFSQSNYVVNIGENERVGTVILNLVTYDKDEDANAKVNFSITSTSLPDAVVVNEKGEVVLDTVLEMKRVFYFNLSVQVMNVAPPYFNSTCFIDVYVYDVNNNKPQFAESLITRSICENFAVGQTIYQCNASDSDTGRNGLLTYRIISGNQDNNFKIKRESGEVILMRELDFEEVQSYILTIFAEDSGVWPLSATQTLIVNVTDVNDNFPLFINCSSSLEIEENLSVNSLIAQCIAADSDMGENGRVSYSLSREKPTGNYFRIGNGGMLYVNKPLDRERFAVHKIDIKVEDNAIPEASRLVTTKTITIRLTDVNDNSPRFSSPPAVYFQGYPSNGDYLTTLSALDPDLGVNGHFTFSKGSGKDASYFQVYKNGRVTFAKASKKLVYSLNVIVTDFGTLQRKTEQALSVFKYREGGLSFLEKSYATSILENEPAGTFVIKVTAVTVPQNNEANIQYFLTNDSSEGLLTLDSTTGVISLTNAVDREGKHGHQLNLVIIAVDVNSATPKSTMTKLMITILDINDNSPTFLEFSYRKNVLESIETGSSITTLQARDEDEGRNGSIKYSIVNGNSNGTFYINSTTGQLFLGNSLDFEEQSMYIINVTASDGGKPSLSSWTIVSVSVLDVNDNAPSFQELDYSFTVVENSPIGTVFGQVFAHDPDSGRNGQLTYSLIGDDATLFSVNAKRGILRTAFSFDRENIGFYLFKVVASDKGSPVALTATAMVYVSVLDENDNDPKFGSDQPYIATVLENSPVETSVISLNATDKDLGLNATLTFTISGGDDNHAFRISSSGTLFTTSLLDRENIAQYNLEITVSDLAAVPSYRRSFTAVITVNVGDMNDHAPYFVSESIIHVREDQDLAKPFASILAKDEDAGLNAEVIYNLQGYSAKKFFQIDQNSGQLSLKYALDRETLETGHINITVEAQDRGQPPKSIQQFIQIIVDDVNDNTPTFERHLKVLSVYENISIGSELLRVHAFDNDLGLNGRVEYTISAGNVNGTFFIHPIDGVVIVRKPLDREDLPNYKIIITAFDLGSPRRENRTAVYIHVVDINDNEPRFEKPPLSKAVKENIPYIQNVAQFVAVDDDEGKNGEVVYSLVHPELSPFLHIDNATGVISLIAPLDREVRSHYSVIMQATDGGTPAFHTQTKFSITVQDENDNSPLFIHPALEPNIVEGSPLGSRLCVMNATDADTGKNADISYSLVNDFGRFRIDQSSGEIVTIAELDREAHGTEFKLIVKARDKGNPSRSSCATVLGRIEDIDDNEAEFESKTYSAYIPVEAPSGRFVTVVSAIDKDQGLNGKVFYKIEGTSSEFRIDANTGHVLTKRSMLSVRTYSLKIQAINWKTNIIQDTAILDVTATKQQFPTFDIPFAVYNISEDAKPGQFILSIKASGNPSFHIVSGDPDQQFSLDIVSKNLTLNKYLDYEKKRNYSLWVRASLSTIYSTYTNIQVLVIDSNDNTPVFEQSSYKASLIENDNENVSVSCIIAKDHDSGAFGSVEYRIQEKNALRWFRIDKYTGCIYTTRGIDREQNFYFDFTVLAQDHGIPSNTNNVSVRVTVLDRNDNPPILYKLSPIYISEDESQPLLVKTVFANDEDEISNLLFSLNPQGNYGKTFRIDSKTGEVFLTKMIDREKVARYPLIVSVTDGKFSDNTTLTVFIKDVDDNPPFFSESRYSVEFTELQPTGSVVTKLNISDEDIGRNADVVYSFMVTPTSELFRIDSFGTITVGTQLRFVKPTNDNGVTNRYNLIVYAENPNHPSVKPNATLTILVTDANDHQPLFERNEYNTYIPCVSKPGTEIITVHAVDDYDVGLNSEVLYRVFGGNGTNFFTVETTTGIVKVNRDISSEQDKLFLLEIQAADRGEPSQISSNTAKIFILVTIENQHSPMFTKKIYTKELKENYEAGKEFLRVLATDGDVGLNGRVKYSIIPGKQGDYFNVDPNTGSLTISSVKLDYEYLREYSFDVQAQDGAQNPRTDRATVTVTVLDYNDNLPEFQKSSFYAEVFENNRVGSEVITVVATDRDTVGNTITYSLLGTDKKFFTINQSSGKITANVRFDYESRTMFTLNVLAKDSGDPQKISSCTVHVKVQGMNEFTPEFTKKKYLFSLNEDAAVGSIVGEILATDKDYGPDGLLQFILVDPSGRNDKFDVDEYTGNIYVRSHLDHESVDLVQLNVLVKNPMQTILTADNTDIATVTINIRDSNDPPRFLQDFMKISVDEDIAVGSVLANFTAVDDDTDIRFLSPFQYSILNGNINEAFILVTVGKSAVVKTNNRFDREVLASYVLTIAATDDTDTNMRGFASLVVDVNDINDNAPFLQSGICPGHIKENLPGGTVVLRLDATDKDIDPNKDPYTFQIMNREHVPFVINKFTSELQTSEVLDREKVPVYVLQIKVLDSGYPKQFSTASCDVIVDDVNDNRPSSDLLNVKINVPATGFLGGIISDVSPLDADERKQYTCKLEGNHKDVFDFQPKSCILNMKKPFLRQYSLNVIAHDSIYRVSYSLNISFNKISETTEQRSVILRLSDISPEKFLAVMKYLPCAPGYEKRIYSVQKVNSSVTDILMTHLENGAFVSRDNLSKILGNCKATLQRQLGAKIIDTNYNLCSESYPCGHGKCEPRVVLFTENDTSLYSGAEIFVSAHHKATFLCTCDPGYSGKYCQHSNRACEEEPCLNTGQCIPTDEGFKCSCPPDFTGKFCGTPVDLCDSNPCNNNSQCLSTHEGVTCQCDFGGRGKRCEFSSIGFKELSYMKFSSRPNSEIKNNISLQFATVERNAMILYCRNDVDFIALEVIEGLLRYSFNLGSHVMRRTSDVIVSDGTWHSVTIVRDEQGGRCYFDSQVSSYKNNNESKANLGNSPLYIGGVPSLDVISTDYVSSYNFIGCMRDIYWNDVALDADTAVSRSGVIDSCPRVPQCHQSSCHDDSACIDKWFNSMCQCTDDEYSGRKCSQNVSALTLALGSVLQFQFHPSYLRQVEFLEKQKSDQSRRRRNADNVDSFSMTVRVRSEDSFLWRAGDNLGNYTQLQIKSGIVHLIIGNIVGGKEQLVVANKYVNNGYWFNISLTQSISSNAFTLNVNGTWNQTHPREPYVFLGGTWTLGTLKLANKGVSSFQGCLSKIKINDEVISLNVSSQYGLLTLEDGSLVEGCDSPDYCASSPCASGECVNSWHSYTCVASLQESESLSIGAIAGIVFFCILVIAIIVAVVAVKKRRTRNEFAARISEKTNSAIERDNSRSSSSESLACHKTQSRHSFSDSGVDIRNRSHSLSQENVKNSTKVIQLGSPDEYTMVASHRDSLSDDRDKRFTDSESEYGVLTRGTNLTISSIPSHGNTGSQRHPSSKQAPLKYSKKVPFLINRGFLKDQFNSSRSTSPSDEPESIEMRNYSNDIENAEQYSIGNASFATYSDLNDPNYNPSRYSDDRMRYKPSLERFSESDGSVDDRQLSTLTNAFEPTPHSSGESSDGGFTASEYDYELRPEFENEENMRRSNRLDTVTTRSRTESYVSDYEREMNGDDPVGVDSINLNDILRLKTSRDRFQTIDRFSDEDVEIV